MKQETLVVFSWKSAATGEVCFFCWILNDLINLKIPKSPDCSTSMIVIIQINLFSSEKSMLPYPGIQTYLHSPRVFASSSDGGLADLHAPGNFSDSFHG